MFEFIYDSVTDAFKNAKRAEKLGFHWAIDAATNGAEYKLIIYGDTTANVNFSEIDDNAIPNIFGNFNIILGDKFIPSWKDAPFWANYLAMDRNGGWYWYESKPSKRKYAFSRNGGRYDIAAVQDWKESLMERPK